jgi:hypothetical protein
MRLVQGSGGATHVIGERGSGELGIGVGLLLLTMLAAIVWGGIQDARQEAADHRASTQPRTMAQMKVTNLSTVDFTKGPWRSPFPGAAAERLWKATVTVKLVNKSDESRRVDLCGPKIVTIWSEFPDQRTTQRVCGEWTVEPHSTLVVKPVDNGLSWELNFQRGMKVLTLDTKTHVTAIEKHPITAARRPLQLHP